MFEIPVSDMLASYTSDSKEFSFSGEIFDGYYDDITFQGPLEFSLQIIAIDDGVEAIFSQLLAIVQYEKQEHHIDIATFSRTWKRVVDPMIDGDDVSLIDSRKQTIDLGPVIREEIIMACHTL